MNLDKVWPFIRRAVHSYLKAKERRHIDDLLFQAYSEGADAMLAEVSHLLRQAVDAIIDATADTPAGRYSMAASLVGRFADCESATDVSSHHDDYLAETYG